MNTDKLIFALGFFDGVHKGHQALLDACCRLARETNGIPCAITFDRHPQSLFCTRVPPLISTVQDRIRLMETYGIRHVRCLPVTEAVMGMHWQDFLLELIRDGAAGFVCGSDFRFGSRGEGNSLLLQDFCAKEGIPCVILPDQTMDGIRISSSHIRTQLESGDMASAVRFLGHPYSLSGTVVRGHQIGRTIGVPTANLRLPEDLAIPRFGVYACVCLVEGKRYPAVTNIGTRPTVSGQGITVEPWILDFERDLYNREITLEFYSFLRSERKFSDLATLRNQILQDADQTRTYLEAYL